MQKPIGRSSRLSSRQKAAAVIRVLRGEDPESVGNELAVPARKVAEWRDIFVHAGQAALKSRAQRGRDSVIEELKELVNELAVRIERIEYFGRGSRVHGGGRLSSPFPRAHRRSKGKNAPT
ncbi:MAG: hypothetical protein HYY28_06820 [Betaproteobacteria bacterium]|nr:hypothetical protein [Betaproteobacteria bacterium]